MKPKVSLIVCMDAVGGIGKAGTLPWKIAEDMRHFRQTTTGHIVVMGGKTFRSIGKALPNRINLVISRGNVSPATPDVAVTTELRHALSIASHAPEKTAFIIGGAQIYAQALGAGIVDELVVTRLGESYGCDTFFPELDWSEWDVVHTKTVPAEQTASGIITIGTYRRANTVEHHPV